MNPRNQAILDKMPTRSAWARGVKQYAVDLLENAEENGVDAPTERDLLNGAEDWNQWAYGGCGLVYDCDIAERLCSPSELRKVKGGERQPNSQETWLDVEARAVRQAARFILRKMPQS